VGSLKADDLHTILSNHHDFKEEKTQVEHTVAKWDMKCLFLPKFHCELNPIERVWGQSKVYARAHTNFTLIKLRQLLDPALDSVSVDLIRKYFRKARDYEQAYREGHNCGNCS
jgi:transposase